MPDSLSLLSSLYCLDLRENELKDLLKSEVLAKYLLSIRTLILEGNPLNTTFEFKEFENARKMIWELKAYLKEAKVYLMGKSYSDLKQFFDKYRDKLKEFEHFLYREKIEEINAKMDKLLKLRYDKGKLDESRPNNTLPINFVLLQMSKDKTEDDVIRDFNKWREEYYNGFTYQDWKRRYGKKLGKKIYRKRKRKKA